MQVTETLNEGLRRKLSVIIPAADLVAKRDERLNDLKDRANIKGFRPGKVPVAHLKKVYGRSVMSEAMQDTINATIQESLTERAERAAAQPEIDLPDDQTVINQVLDGTADLTFEVVYEVLPKIEPMDFKSIKIEQPVVEVAAEEVDKEVNRVFLNNREFERKGEDGVVAQGDKLGLKFVGKIDGEPFEGGSSDHAHLTVGAGEYIPGFEDQLVGMKVGEPRQVKVTFPKDYGSAELAGKNAVFEVEVLHIDGPKGDAVLNDAFAQALGLENLEQLKTEVRRQMEQAHEQMARQRVKRQVLDALDDGHTTEVPGRLVEAEFSGIWQRVTHEIEHHGRSFEDEGTTEEEARAQYRRIAERRVKLGLVIAEIGNRNEIQVSEEEHQQALVAEIRRFPGQEQQVYDYYRKNPQALASLRAPVFENKVVDFIIELADKTEKKMTRAELAKLIEQDEAEHEVPEEHHH
ncbi:MAG: trigger factor [Alphaproteobacteria bacterium]|nr:trigger factor [Alphaproteobacteria bacterium]